MKKIYRHNGHVQNNLPVSLPKKHAFFMCISAFLLSLIIVFLDTQANLQKSCSSVTNEFSAIMHSYQHSFQLFEKLLQQEVINVGDADKIEEFLKTQDKPLLDIEGGDYDGVYMYYHNRYLYSWDTPHAAYDTTGYDATKRPWYIGAVQANGKIFFSTPYPSYANDYMLATISRLQEDKETVIAYDIKLGEIGKYVDRLDLFNGALTLICDKDGNIIGSTNHLYQGGNYLLSDQILNQNIALSSEEYEKANSEKTIKKAEQKLKCAKAQKQFVSAQKAYLFDLKNHKDSLKFSMKNLSFGFAHSDGKYTCFVIAPAQKLIPRVITIWAAFSFLFIVIYLLISRLKKKSSQVLFDTLTGLNNRRAFLRYTDHHIRHHADEELCLLMLDLNHFKSINDLYGHITGDYALLDTATVLQDACADAQKDYFLCRYGGDEFLLAGTKCTLTDLKHLKNLITEGLMLKNKTGKNQYVLEASIGISHGICDNRIALELLLSQADDAMYAEKKSMER